MISRIVLLCLCFLPCFSFSQIPANKIIIAGSAPKISIFEVEKEGVSKMLYLKKDRESRIRVLLEGGIENVRHQLIISSKQAVITCDSLIKNEYIVKPISDVCEIIVDIKTMEDYYVVKNVVKQDNTTERVMEKMPPKTYMLGYERFSVK